MEMTNHKEKIVKSHEVRVLVKNLMPRIWGVRGGLISKRGFLGWEELKRVLPVILEFSALTVILEFSALTKQLCLIFSISLQVD